MPGPPDRAVAARAADNIDEAGPGLAVQGRGPFGVALPGPVRIGRPRPLGEANSFGSIMYSSRPRTERLRPQVALKPTDVGPTVVGEPVLADEHGGVDTDVPVVVDGMNSNGFSRST